MSLTLAEVGHRFGDGPWLFRGLTYSFQPGRVYALTGPSGSGKSTLLSILAGWEAPTEGSVRAMPEANVRWVFQHPHGVAHRRAADHVALPFLARGMAIEEADRLASRLLRRFDLERLAERPFRELSGGEAQRLMLARGLAAEPTLLLVDEPTAQLDQSTAQTVNESISAAASEGTIIVVATHDHRTRDACTDHLDLETYRYPSVPVVGGYA